MAEFTWRAPEFLTPAGTLRPWLGEQGIAFREAIAIEADAFTLSAELVGKARLPLECDASVLPIHGLDRRIPRYTTETELSYRRRLAKWLQIWNAAGSTWGILRQLRIYLLAKGRPRLRIVSSAGDNAQAFWSTLEPGTGQNDYFDLVGLDPEFTTHVQTPSNWVWDANLGLWSRYGVMIYTDGLDGMLPSASWDGGEDWDGGAIWDGYFTAAEISDMVSLCTDWQAAQSQIAWLMLVHDPTAFDPNGTSATLPDGRTTYPAGSYDLFSKRREGVTYSYVRIP